MEKILAVAYMSKVTFTLSDWGFQVLRDRAILDTDSFSLSFN